MTDNGAKIRDGFWRGDVEAVLSGQHPAYVHGERRGRQHHLHSDLVRLVVQKCRRAPHGPGNDVRQLREHVRRSVCARLPQNCHGFQGRVRGREPKRAPRRGGRDGTGIVGVGKKKSRRLVLVPVPTVMLDTFAVK